MYTKFGHLKEITQLQISSVYYNSFSHIDDLFPEYSKRTVHNVEDLKPGILILHGGEDISPYIYGQNSYTHTVHNLSRRDRLELELLEQAVAKKMTIFGICRGAQLLTAFAGGSLFQHVDGHGGNHQVMSASDKTFVTNSAHHQMCNLKEVDHRLLAWSSPRISKQYWGESGLVDPPECEPELFVIPKIKALAVQGHPEWLSKKDAYVKYIMSHLKQLHEE